MRGVMEFDDFNYAVHNPYVLIEDPKFAENYKLPSNQTFENINLASDRTLDDDLMDPKRRDTAGGSQLDGMGSTFS